MSTQWLTDWLSKNGKHFVMAAIVAFAAFEQVYPFVDPHLANTILAVAAALGLYSGSPTTKEIYEAHPSCSHCAGGGVLPDDELVV
jgi:hypothetical protein